MSIAKRAASETGDPLLLTPGPLTTSTAVKQAMVHDWGSRDAEFLRINRMVLDKIVELAGAEGTHVTVPVQGSGTFAVEAMITSFVPRTGKLLVLINGAYGQRAKKIAEIAGRAVAVHETPEDTPPDLAKLEKMLAEDKAITHVFAVHCETTSGILNPIGDIAALVARQGRRLLVETCMTSGRTSRRPDSTASRRRSTSSWRWARRSRSMPPRVASPAVASAIARMPGC